MARILINVQDASFADAIEKSLISNAPETIGGQGAGHEILRVSDFDWGKRVMESGVDLVLCDYITQDAHTVKMIQQIRIQSATPQFIVFVDDGVSLSHIVMAMNTGALAVLDLPVNYDALSNYVQRALDAVKAERHRTSELEHYRQLMAKEQSRTLRHTEEISQYQRRIKQFARLINHLLTIPTNPGQNKTLLVSDSTFQLDQFSKALKKNRFQVITAKDGREGLEKAVAEKPRIIISDLELPKMSGLELCRAVKNDERLIPNYFIISTANANRIAEILKPENKVDDCLIKPERTDNFQEFTARAALGLIG